MNLRAFPRPGRSWSTGLAVGVTATAAALVGTLLLAPSSSAVTIDSKLSASHRWPTLTPQGARWWDPATAGPEEYFFTYPRQGSAADRRTGSTRYYGIRVWQEALNEQGIPVKVNGYYGVEMRTAVRKFQARYNSRVSAENRIPVDGRIGYVTSRALLAPTIKRMAAKHGMPAKFLCGHLAWESGLDGRSVGPGGTDFGLAQMSRRYHQKRYTVGEAFDKDLAIDYMARRDKAARRTFGSYRIAVVSYWSPREAWNWKRTGKPSDAAKRYSDGIVNGCGADHLWR